MKAGSLGAPPRPPSFRLPEPLIIPPLHYLDRYRNEGTRAYSPHAAYTEAEEGYRPDSPSASFELPCFDVPLDDLTVYEGDPPPALRRAYLGPDSARFSVHPQLLLSDRTDPILEKLRAQSERLEPLTVSPSSSTRTLYVLHREPEHALKVHFPFRVSRYGRRMRDEVVEQAVWVSSQLQLRANRLGTRFSFFREVLGVTHRRLQMSSPRRENWGYLLRDLEPFPRRPGRGHLIPGFALYGRDFFEPEAPLLLLSLMEGKDPRSFLLEGIMFPIIRHWARCYQELGFQLEPHGQNVLLDLDEEGRIRRIVHRDLNLGIDMRRRRDLGLQEDLENTYNRSETGDFGSVTYDKFMGGHFFDPLLAAVRTQFPGLTGESLRSPCREEFARVFPEHRDYLPRTVRYFSEERDQFGKPLLEDTGAAPVWRP